VPHGSGQAAGRWAWAAFRKSAIRVGNARAVALCPAGACALVQQVIGHLAPPAMVDQALDEAVVIFRMGLHRQPPVAIDQGCMFAASLAGQGLRAGRRDDDLILVPGVQVIGWPSKS
jgi:hypothetical protein